MIKNEKDEETLGKVKTNESLRDSWLKSRIEVSK
jgi:hypothetical protein